MAELTGVPHGNGRDRRGRRVWGPGQGQATVAVVGKGACGYVYVDGLSVGEVTESSLKGPADHRRGRLRSWYVERLRPAASWCRPGDQHRRVRYRRIRVSEVRPKIEEAMVRAADAEGINDAHQRAAGPADGGRGVNAELPAAGR